MMNEIRIRERTFLFGLALISFVIFYLILVDRCEPQSNHKFKDRQRINYISLDAAQGPHPCTVYAVTPTYSRPVQKAELTR